MTASEQSKLEAVRKAYSNLNTIDPDGEAYKNLCAYLDKLDDSMLVIVAAAKIKFASSLAMNRWLRRGI